MKRKRNSKVISLLLAVMMILSSLPFAGISALAATSGDFEYKILEDGTAEITGYTGSAETLEIPSALDSYTVTSIGANVFYDCDSLTNITIPNSVTSIGDRAFEYCTSLTSITIPDSVTSIGKYAFWDCEGLTKITVPDSVTSIGASAFSGTGYYNDDANWENGVLYIGNHLIKANSDEIPSEYSINEGTVSIADSAFEGCVNLTNITVDENNKNYSSQDGVLFNKEKTELIQYPIGNERTSYNIPNGVISIGDYAFEYCDSLTSVTIPDSVTSIGEMAFAGCGSLTSLTIPSSVTSIGYVPFVACYSLTTITADENSKNYSSQDGVLFNKEKTELIQYPIGNERASYDIPSSVASIGAGAFAFCESLTGVTIPNSVTSIGVAAFGYCNGLTSVTIPSSVASIGDNAFNSCYSLTNITIPESVTSIGYGVFDYSAIETIYGYENSYAQTYAKENGYEFISIGSVGIGMFGDVNGDGNIDPLDVLIVKRYIAEFDDAKLEGDAFARADVSGDGKVDPLDVLFIMQKIAEIIDSFDKIK